MNPLERPFRAADLTATALESFDLNDLVAQLVLEPRYHEEGKSGVTLARGAHVSVVLEVLRKGSEFREHRAPASPMVTLLSGRATFVSEAGVKRTAMIPGTLVAVASDLEHTVVDVPERISQTWEGRAMKATNRTHSLAASALLAVTVALTPHIARAHCDGMDGPVVGAAKNALAETNVNLVLIWVQKDDEAQIRDAFEKTLAVRKLNPEARELADLYFFETLVRIHRTGEGAPYTGLKPAGRDLGPAIPAGDEALATGDIEPVLKLLTEKTEHGVREHFRDVSKKGKFDPSDVTAGRGFVKAYVEYIHYVEGIYQATTSAAHGHFPDAAETHE